MSTTSKQMKEQIRKEREAKANEESVIAEQKRIKALLAQNQQPQPLVEEESVFTIAENGSAPQQDLLEAFDQKFGEKNREGSKLSFPSDEEAIAFFKDQAAKGQAFCYFKQGEDKVAFSDGNGHFKVGTQQEIQIYCQEQDIESPFAPPTIGMPHQ